MTALASAISTTPTGKPYAFLPLANDGDSSIDIETLRQHVPVRRCKHAAGQGVYHAGQPFQALYLVHAGSYKTCELADDGR